jgi:hypothetical protein
MSLFCSGVLGAAKLVQGSGRRSSQPVSVPALAGAEGGSQTDGSSLELGTSRCTAGRPTQETDAVGCREELMKSAGTCQYCLAALHSGHDLVYTNRFIIRHLAAPGGQGFGRRQCRGDRFERLKKIIKTVIIDRGYSRIYVRQYRSRLLTAR